MREDRKQRRGWRALMAALTVGVGLMGPLAGAQQDDDDDDEGEAPAAAGVYVPGPNGYEARHLGSRWDALLEQSPPVRFDGEWPRFQLLATNNPGYPQVSRNGLRLVLTPEERGGAAALAFAQEDLRAPFAIEFQYSIQDDDGGGPWTSGDGLVLMFGRRPPQPTSRLPAGSGRAFLRDGSGYGVHLTTYGPERGVLLTDGRGRTLAARRLPTVFNHGRWSTVRVEVENDAIRAWIDGQAVLEWRGRVRLDSGGWGLGAASGAADSRHAVRRVRVARTPGAEPLPPVPAPTPTPTPVPAPVPTPPEGTELLSNGGFEEPGLTPGQWRAVDALPGWSRVRGRVLEVHHRVAGNPAAGRQHLELDGQDNSAIFQEVPTRPGGEYELRFAFSARPRTGLEDNALEVVWNGRVVARVEGSGQGRSETAWTYTVLHVWADGNTSRLEFRDVGRSNGLGTYLDDVSLRPVGPGAF